MASAGSARRHRGVRWLHGLKYALLAALFVGSPLYLALTRALHLGETAALTVDAVFVASMFIYTAFFDDEDD